MGTGEAFNMATRVAIGAVLVLCLILFAAASSRAEALFADNWQDDMRAEITKALSGYGVTRCAFYKYKKSIESLPPYSGCYLVYCSQDKHKWQGYLVWPEFNMVMGPSKPDPKFN